MEAHPGIYKGKVLDHALANGYFRMGNELFTTQEVPIGYEGRRRITDIAFWLRLNLSKAKETKTTRRIRKKCAGFTYTIEPAYLTPEIELLYYEYYLTIPFDGYFTCRECIPEMNTEDSAFDTLMINIRNKGRLIGVGFFDIGKQALMSVLHFYHPDYKRFSIGKYIILLTKDFARSRQMDFVYPGYFLMGQSKMDYKLFPQKEAMELYLTDVQIWEPVEKFTKIELYNYYFKEILGVDLVQTDDVATYYKSQKEKLDEYGEPESLF
ncbi:GNAT family protein [Sediminibacterium salmoneum]|uniref:hypothetical protein n=1 Tax=Sediminibacterium salmoneum TaxID=426421 RepID=UPI00047CE5A0|nr:hypothetical protein [Sediminibacterium salmoneum]